MNHFVSEYAAHPMRIASHILLILLLCGLCGAQNPLPFMPQPRQQFVDQNGVPLSGGFLFTYAAGTSTPLATYHLDTLGNLTPNQNPVILDVTGSAEVRLLPQAYKMVLQNSSNAQVWAIDMIQDFGQLALTDSVLLNPPLAALQTIAGPLAFTTLSLGSGTPLTTTNQSGTGSLCLIIGCALQAPIINTVLIANTPGTYINVPNATVTGTTMNSLVKFAAAAPSWIKRNDKSGSGTGSPQVTAVFATSLTNPSLIVVLAQGPVGTFSVTDTATNTYIDCGPGQVIFNGSANGVECFYALNTHTTASNVVSFASTGGGAMTVTATEWTGAALINPVDVIQNSGANASSGTGGGQNVSSGATTTSGADLVVGLAGVTAGALTAGTGFTPSTSAALEYQTQSGPGSLAATWNDNTNNDSYAALLVAFRPYTGTSAAAVTPATTDTSGVVGICVAACGTSGTATIQQSGEAYCNFDGAANVGDYVQISSSFGGTCHDAGNVPSSVTNQTIGQVVSTTGSSPYLIALATGGNAASSFGSVKTLCAASVPVFVSANVTTDQVLGTCQLTSGSLNLAGKSFRITFQGEIVPGGTSVSYAEVGIGASTALSSFIAFASQPSSSSTWNVSGSITCTVNTSGALGTVRCASVSSATGSGSPVSIVSPSNILGINLTGPLFVGTACRFATGSASNNCDQFNFVVEQLN